MRILTAFTNSLGGRDSYHLGVSLAEAFSCPLDLVTVVKGGGGRYVLDVTDHAFQDVVATQVDDWMSEIMEEHRPRVPVSKYLRYSLSFPEGIIASAEELKADLLVAGGGRHGVLGRVSLGSVGQTLLNSSTVPVALSPRGMSTPLSTGSHASRSCWASPVGGGECSVRPGPSQTEPVSRCVSSRWPPGTHRTPRRSRSGPRPCSPRCAWISPDWMISVSRSFTPTP